MENGLDVLIDIKDMKDCMYQNQSKREMELGKHGINVKSKAVTIGN